MKLVISPAKSLNYTSELPTKEFTQSCFLKEAEMLNSILKITNEKYIYNKKNQKFTFDA